jgi:hypothetical protein
LYIPEYPASSSFSNGAEQLAWHIKGFGEDERGGRMRSLRKFTLIFVIAVLLSNIAWGWGREGHRIIATVAEDHLNETTKVMIQSLIGNNRLYSISSWADDIRKDHRETGPWHYVNIPLGSTYNASRDCPTTRSCVVEKIGDFVKVLMDKKAPREQVAVSSRYILSSDIPL